MSISLKIESDDAVVSIPKLRPSFSAFSLLIKANLNAAEVFPQEWLNRGSIVVFDYLGLEDQIEGSVYNDLFCIIPTIGRKTYAYIQIFKREDFIENIKNGVLHTFVKNYTTELNNILLGEQMLLSGQIQIVRKKNPHPSIKRSRHL